MYQVPQLFRKNRSEAIVISAYAAAGGCIFQYRSDRTFSGLLTLAAALQSLGLALLLVAVSRGARFVSRETVVLMALALACRLFCSARYSGYLPTDRSGDGPLQAIDALSLVICFVLFIAHPGETVHQKRVSKEAAVDTSGRKACPKPPPARSSSPRADVLLASTDSDIHGPAFPTLLSEERASSEMSDCQCVEHKVQSEVQSLCFPAHALAAACAVVGVIVRPNLLENFVGDSLWTAGQLFECAALLPQLRSAAESGTRRWHASFFGPMLLARVTAFPFWVAVRRELDHVGGRAWNLSGTVLILAQVLQFSLVGVVVAAKVRSARTM